MGNYRDNKVDVESKTLPRIRTWKAMFWKMDAGQRHSFGVFIANFEHISHLALVFLLLTLNM